MVDTMVELKGLISIQQCYDRDEFKIFTESSHISMTPSVLLVKLLADSVGL